MMVHIYNNIHISTTFLIRFVGKVGLSETHGSLVCLINNHHIKSFLGKVGFFFLHVHLKVVTVKQNPKVF
jgi:hypothetical protein